MTWTKQELKNFGLMAVNPPATEQRLSARLTSSRPPSGRSLRSSESGRSILPSGTGTHAPKRSRPGMVQTGEQHLRWFIEIVMTNRFRPWRGRARLA